MTTILLTGKNGQVGWELAQALGEVGQVFAFDRAGLDLADLQVVRDRIREIKPDIIVNAAAYTAVDRAETEPGLAMHINGVVPGVLAEEARRRRALLVHYSTDYVFDGNKNGGYVETDEPVPLSIYGKSKLAGDRAIEEVGGLYLILRTSWVYGMRGSNFLRTMLRAGKEQQQLSVVNDQIGSPTWCKFISEATRQILLQHISGRDSLSSLPDVTGVYHLTSGGSVSWHGFAEQIFRIARQTENYAVKTIQSIKSDEWPSPAKRPKNSVLVTEKVRKTFRLTIPSWDEGLANCMNSRQSAGLRKSSFPQ